MDISRREFIALLGSLSYGLVEGLDLKEALSDFFQSHFQLGEANIRITKEAATAILFSAVLFSHVTSDEQLERLVVEFSLLSAQTKANQTVNQIQADSVMTWLTRWNTTSPTNTVFPFRYVIPGLYHESLERQFHEAAAEPSIRSIVPHGRLSSRAIYRDIVLNHTSGMSRIEETLFDGRHKNLLPLFASQIVEHAVRLAQTEEVLAQSIDSFCNRFYALDISVRDPIEVILGRYAEIPALQLFQGLINSSHLVFDEAGDIYFPSHNQGQTLDTLISYMTQSINDVIDLQVVSLPNQTIVEKRLSSDKDQHLFTRRNARWLQPTPQPTPWLTPQDFDKLTKGVPTAGKIASFLDKDLGRAITIIAPAAIKWAAAAASKDPFQLVGASVALIDSFAEASRTPRPSPEALLHERLGKKMEEIRVEMNSRFDQVDAKLDLIFQTLVDEFKQIRADVLRVEQRVIQIDKSIHNVETNILNAIMNLSFAPLDDAIDFTLKPLTLITERDFVWYETVFYDWVHHRSSESNVIAPYDDDSPDMIEAKNPYSRLKHLTRIPLFRDLNILQKLSNGLWTPVYGPNHPTMPLPNLDYWLKAAFAYVSFLEDYPSFTANHVLRARIQDLVDVGNRVRDDFKLVAVQNGEANEPLFKYLAQNYWDALQLMFVVIYNYLRVIPQVDLAKSADEIANSLSLSLNPLNVVARITVDGRLIEIPSDTTGYEVQISPQLMLDMLPEGYLRVALHIANYYAYYQQAGWQTAPIPNLEATITLRDNITFTVDAEIIDDPNGMLFYDLVVTVTSYYGHRLLEIHTARAYGLDRSEGLGTLPPYDLVRYWLENEFRNRDTVTFEDTSIDTEIMPRVVSELINIKRAVYAFISDAISVVPSLSEAPSPEKPYWAAERVSGEAALLRAFCLIGMPRAYRSANQVRWILTGITGLLDEGDRRHFSKAFKYASLSDGEIQSRYLDDTGKILENRRDAYENILGEPADDLRLEVEFERMANERMAAASMIIVSYLHELSSGATEDEMPELKLVVDQLAAIIDLGCESRLQCTL